MDRPALRWLCLIDDATREGSAILADFSIAGERVLHLLDDLAWLSLRCGPNWGECHTSAVPNLKANPLGNQVHSRLDTLPEMK